MTETAGITEFTNTLRALAGIVGVSGDEDAVARAISALAAPYADETHTDALGNLIVRRRGPGPHVMLSARMDTAGLLVTHVDAAGFARVAPVGALPLPHALGHAFALAGGARGVLAHEGKTAPKDVTWEHCYLDFGASGRENCAAQVGDRAALAAETFVAGSRVVSPGLSGRAGCAVLLRVLAQMRPPACCDLSFVFTAQGALGARGARTASYALAPAWAVSVGVSETGDTPESAHKNEVTLGGGGALRVMDDTLITPAPLLRLLEDTARARQIPLQRAVPPRGGSDAGAVLISRSGVPAGAVDIPVRYAHTAVETADLRDFISCSDLIAALPAAFSALEAGGNAEETGGNAENDLTRRLST
ncbi:MAG: M42 family peptidase [Oscillospiraceae bacterium]|jgi:endoglucanase|nr:M42 family peptidase [Oscillospiraceae bacterium]